MHGKEISTSFENTGIICVCLAFHPTHLLMIQVFTGALVVISRTTACMPTPRMVSRSCRKQLPSETFDIAA